jgi:FtsP/CotA-like multicopper oxidase with cupredoxin domain
MIFLRKQSSFLEAATTAALFWILQSDDGHGGTVVADPIKEYTFDIQSKLGEVYSPDCQNVQEQRRWLTLVSEPTKDIDAAMPGPLIEAIEGDTIRITVTNHHATNEATLHFHGLHLLDTPFSDGPSMITQCGLPPGQTQTYEFFAYPPGTHYWHGHVTMSLSDGT